MPRYLSAGRWRRSPRPHRHSRADYSRQPLRYSGKAASRRSDTARFPCQQARDDAGRVVRVQRGKNQVTRERCLGLQEADFQVAGFADHDDVRVMAEKRTQHRLEGQARALLTPTLIHTASASSTGSSTDITFFSGLTSLIRIEYCVVVLPDPVGRRRLCGRSAVQSCGRGPALARDRNPSLSRPRRTPDLSRILRTIPSP